MTAARATSLHCAAPAPPTTIPTRRQTQRSPATIARPFSAATTTSQQLQSKEKGHPMGGPFSLISEDARSHLQLPAGKESEDRVSGIHHLSDGQREGVEVRFHRPRFGKSNSPVQQPFLHLAKIAACSRSRNPW